MDSTLHLAVAGLGDFGLRYARAFLAQPGVHVRWGCDLDEARHAHAQAAGVESVTRDIGQVISDPDVDAVIVATPESAHREIAVAAMSAGKHVIIEKPLATNDADGLAIVRSASDNDVLLLPAFLLRFDYRYAQLKERVTQLGPIRNVYAYRNFDRRLFRTYSRTHSFIENAIHDIDILLWLLGSEPVTVHGFCRSVTGLPNPDVNWGVLEFPDGAIAVIQTSWLYPDQEHHNLQWNSGLQVMADGGVLEISNDQAGFRANTTDDGILLLDQTAWSDIHGEPRGAFGAMIRHFARCLRGEAQPLGASPTEALTSMRIAQRLITDANRRTTNGSTGEHA